MFTGTEFTYDGIQGSEYGLKIVNLDEGTRDVPFGISRELLTTEMKHKSYSHGIKKNQLAFSITFSREEIIDDDTRIELVKWFFQDEFKPLISEDNPDIIYYCMPIGDQTKLMVGNNPRAFTLNFLCSDSHAWSPVYENTYDLSDNTSSTVITMENNSNVEKYYYPEITITTVGEGDIILKNITDDNREFKLSNLLANETVYINNELQEIETDVDSVYRLDDFNRNWLRLLYGENQIEVTGACTITTNMQYPMAL